VIGFKKWNWMQKRIYNYNHTQIDNLQKQTTVYLLFKQPSVL